MPRLAAPNWRHLCVRLPGGLWLIGPATRSAISAGLDDAVAFRRSGLDTAHGCTGCPTPRDLAELAALGLDPVPPCADHQLDRDAALVYEGLLGRIAVTGRELARIRETLHVKGGT